MEVSRILLVLVSCASSLACKHVGCPYPRLTVSALNPKSQKPEALNPIYRMTELSSPFDTQNNPNLQGHLGTRNPLLLPRRQQHQHQHSLSHLPRHDISSNSIALSSPLPPPTLIPTLVIILLLLFQRLLPVLISYVILTIPTTSSIPVSITATFSSSCSFAPFLSIN